MGAHIPFVWSQFCPFEQVACSRHIPSVQMSVNFSAVPLHASAPGTLHTHPNATSVQTPSPPAPHVRSSSQVVRAQVNPATRANAHAQTPCIKVAVSRINLAGSPVSLIGTAQIGLRKFRVPDLDFVKSNASIFGPDDETSGDKPPLDGRPARLSRM
jgi:hypothetical protein